MLNPLARVGADDNTAGTSNTGVRDTHDAVYAATRHSIDAGTIPIKV